jgi:hypothetical protein
MFCSSQFLSTLFAVRSARPRKKNSAAKNYDVEKKKIAYLARAVMSAFGTFRTWRDVRLESAMRYKANIGERNIAACSR